MSVRRLIATTAVLGALALVLRLLAPAPQEIAAAVTGPQRLVVSAGPGALLLCAVGALAWLIWAWGALGLAVTAATALPGLGGAAARAVQRLLVPAAARRAAAAVVGLGIGLGGPGFLAAAGATPVTVAATSPVPDWPSAPSTPAAPTTGAPAAPVPVPDWPDATGPTARVVVRGDCLWDIAAAALGDRSGAAPTNAETAAAVDAWWRANEPVIGPDPDLLLPGQVLHPPGDP